MVPKTKEQFLATLDRLDRDELVKGAYQFLQLSLVRNTSKMNAIIRIRHAHDKQVIREAKRYELRMKQQAYMVASGMKDPGEFYGSLSKSEARKFRKQFRKDGLSDIAAAPRVKEKIDPLLA